MKKFLFSLSMVAALSLAVFTTSCGDDDDNGNILPQTPPESSTDGGSGEGSGDGATDSETTENQTAEYTSTLKVVTGSPEEVEAGNGEDLGTITEDVKIEINKEQSTVGLSIKGINLGILDNIPEGLQAPFDIELQGVPYTNDGNDIYTIDYNPNFDSEAWSGDVAIDINGNNAYLFSLKGLINGENLELTFFVLGDENLLNIPVNIFVAGTKKQ